MYRSIIAFLLLISLASCMLRIKPSDQDNHRMAPALVKCSDPYANPATTAASYYNLPPSITSLTWVYPADVMYDATGNVIQSNLSTVLSPTIESSKYCDFFIVQGGLPPYTFSVQNQPKGLTISESGLYSGRATQVGIFSNIIFCAVDMLGNKACLLPRTQQVCATDVSVCP